MGDLFPPPKIVIIYGRRSWLCRNGKQALSRIGLMIPGIGIERGDAGQRSSLIREDTSTFLRDVLHLLTWMDIFRILFCFRRSGWTKDSARLRTR